MANSCWNRENQNVAKKTGDALISAKQGDTLGIFTADCVPIFILDKVTPAIGIAHAGWRGTLARIATKTIAKMKVCLALYQKTVLSIWVLLSRSVVIR